jgi:hypothetical protein
MVIYSELAKIRLVKLIRDPVFAPDLSPALPNVLQIYAN